MTIEEALSILDTILDQVPLNDVQELVFRHAWENWTYEQIAAHLGYTTDYVRNVGSHLWNAMSERLGVRIRKNNLQSEVRRWAQHHHVAVPVLSPPPPRTTTVDLSEAPDVSYFTGREEALATLSDWITDNSQASESTVPPCRFIALLGMGGMGKTALAAKFAQSVAAQFDAVIWRSLRHAPPIETLLLNLTQCLSPSSADPTPPGDRQSLISRFIAALRQQRCLVILDNAESVLPCQGSAMGQTNGYSELFEHLCDLVHEGCVLVTSREKPDVIAWKEGITLPVRSLQLKGVSDREAKTIFATKGTFFGSAADWQTLTQHYAGNPLALKMVATAIQDVFQSNLVEFLAQLNTFVFDDIQDLLDRQFARLSPVEREVMFWLAINREITSFQDLRDDILCPLVRQTLPSVLRSLKHRFLIEATPEGFTQQPVVMDYITQRLIAQVSQEFLQPLAHSPMLDSLPLQAMSLVAATSNSTPAHPFAVRPTSDSPSPDAPLPLLQTHALLKATAQDYIRESQTQFILVPLVERLIATLRSPLAVEQQCRDQLQALQADLQAVPGYAAGNLIHLLRTLQVDLTGINLSHLTIRQVPFQLGPWHQVDLSHCTLHQCVFLETLGTVWAVAFSPNGEWLAASDATGNIHIWRVADQQKVVTLQGHTKWVCAIAFSPDSQWLASGSIGNVIKLWEVKTGSCLRTFRGQPEWVLAVAFHPSGQWLASSSSDGMIHLWQPQTGHCIQTIAAHQDWVSTIGFSPDGTLLASGSDDGTLKLWDSHSLTCLKTLTGHTGAIRSIAFSPEGHQIASGSSDPGGICEAARTLNLWDVAAGTCLATLSGHHHPVRSVAYQVDPTHASPTPRLISASEDGTLRIWHPPTGACIQVIAGHQGQIRALAVHPEGQLFASGSADQTVKLWNSRGHCLRTLQGYTNFVLSVACAPADWTPDSAALPLVATGSSDRAVRIWNSHTGQCLHTLKGHTHDVWTVAFCPHPLRLSNDPRPRHLLASGSTDQTIRLWDVQSGDALQVLRGHTDWVHAIAFSPDGHLLASASSDQTVRIWEVSTGQCLTALQGHESHVWSVAFSPGAPLLASSSDDQTIKLWDGQTGQCWQTLVGHSRRVQAIAFSPQGEWLASSSSDQTIAIWEVSTGRCLRTLTPTGDHVRAIAFSPLQNSFYRQTGQLLLASYAETTLQVWNAHTGALISTLQGHTHPIWSLAFSADGQTLVSGSEDHTTRLWNLATGQCVQVLKNQPPYQGMKLTQIQGVTKAQKQTLMRLGAVE